MMDAPSNLQPLLKRQKLIIPDEPITHLAAGLNHVAYATKDKSIFLVNIRDEKQTDCDLNLYLRTKLMQAKVHKLFLDPTSKFTFISLAYATDNQPMENLLFVKRLQPLNRLKGHLISAIGWNYPQAKDDPSANNTSNSTGTILLGTTKGLVLQAEFIHSDESKFFPLSGGPRQYVKEIFDIGPDLGAITGIEFHQIPSTNPIEKAYIIFISTNSRLYRMVGSVPANIDPPPLATIFAQNNTNYKDVPGRLINSKLDFFYPGFNIPPVRYAWLTEPSVMTGEIQNDIEKDRLALSSTTEMVTLSYENKEEFDMLPLSLSSTPIGTSPSLGFHYRRKPISIVTTNFHVIVLFRTYMKAICILNSAIVYEEYLTNKYGEIHGMAKDPVKNTIWVYCDRAILRYKITNEDKTVWRIFLEQKKFDMAKKYSKNDPIDYDRVLCEEAQHYFYNHDYEKSAEIFAQTKKPFEDITLMFMEIGATKALRKYLFIRLDQFDPEQNIQKTMILGWLLELIISDLSVKANNSEEPDDEIMDQLTDLQELLSNKQVLECFHRNPTLFYGIIRNYSDQETFVRLAKLIGDFGHVVEHYMDLGEYGKALDIMKVIKRDDLFYSYGHILMKRMPKELVDAFMDQPTINPSELIPVLIQENAYFNKCSETIRYLEFCIKTLHTDSRVIYNYLFELYARHRDEDTLIEYLENHIQPESTGIPSYLDVQLCLRLCHELKLTRTCVSLYSAMGLFDEAVDLAMTFDIELAKKIANNADSDEHQKQLWLTISKKILTKNLDIQVATGLLKQCRLLRIEDILPFFPHYTTIDFFREAIGQSLQAYKDQILSLKDGTYEKIADDIRNEIKTFRNRYSIIKVAQRCEVCSRGLMSKAFYVFPCGHLFHKDCILKEIIEIDPSYMGIDVKLKQLGIDSNKPNLSNQQTFLVNSTSSQAKLSNESTSRIEEELEKIISSECIYCGSLLPSYIDRLPVLTTELDD